MDHRPRRIFERTSQPGAKDRAPATKKRHVRTHENSFIWVVWYAGRRKETRGHQRPTTSAILKRQHPETRTSLKQLIHRLLPTPNQYANMVPLVLRRSPPPPPPPPPPDRRVRAWSDISVACQDHPHSKPRSTRRKSGAIQDGSNRTTPRKPHTSIMAHTRRSSGSAAAVTPPRFPGKYSVSPTEPPEHPPPPPSPPWRPGGRDRSANKRPATLPGSSLNTYRYASIVRSIVREHERCLKHAVCASEVSGGKKALTVRGHRIHHERSIAHRIEQGSRDVDTDSLPPIKVSPRSAATSGVGEQPPPPSYPQTSG